MPEIKVRVTGDNGDFKKKLREASEESRVAAAEMREQFGELAHRAGDIAGEFGLGKVGHLLKDLTGGAALAFGTALVGGLLEGIKKASEFGDALARLGIQMGNLQAGKELGEYVERLALAGPGGPTKEALLGASQTMLGAGMREEEVRAWLPRIQRLSAGAGLQAEQLGEMIAGGSVGITRGLEHSPLVRGAMQASGQSDPLKALAWVSDTVYASALDVMSARPSGRIEGTKRQIGSVIEQMGASFLDPTLDPAGYYERQRAAAGLFSSGLNPQGLSLGPSQGIFPAGSDLKEAAKNIRDATEDQKAVWRKFGDMWDVR
jgi:hypothetical protein